MGKRAQRVKGSPAAACHVAPFPRRKGVSGRHKIVLECVSHVRVKGRRSPLLQLRQRGSALAVRGPLRLLPAMSPSGFSGKPGKGVSRMRYLFAALVLAAAVWGTAAQAEKRTFIVANNSDGYGVDRCLASGASCGVAVATAYCKSRDYVEGASFRQLEREEIAGAVPTTTGTSARDEFVAIECLR